MAVTINDPRYPDLQGKRYDPKLLAYANKKRELYPEDYAGIPSELPTTPEEKRLQELMGFGGLTPAGIDRSFQSSIGKPPYVAPSPPAFKKEFDYSGMMPGASDYSDLLDFAGQGAGASQYLSMLPGAQREFSDYYTAPEDTSGKAFQDYLGKINAPGGTEEVRKRLESDALTQTLADIDRDTAQQIADLKMSMQERGIAGPGQTSDIEQVALAQAGASGGRTKAQARTTLQSQQLERESAKEKAVAEAYGTRYGAEVAKAGQERQLAAQAATTDVTAANQLLQLAFTTGAQGEQSQLDRTLKAKETIANLTSQEKMNTLNNLYKMLIANADNEVEREKIKTNYDIAQLEAESALERTRISNQPKGGDDDIWGNIFSTILSTAASAAGTAAGGAIGEGLASRGSQLIGGTVDLLSKKRNPGQGH